MIPVSKVFFEILRDLQAPSFDHLYMLDELEKRHPHLSPVSLNSYSRYINQFIPLCLSTGILRKEKHFNKALPIFILQTVIDESLFAIVQQPEFDDFADDFELSELIKYSVQVVMNTAEIMARMSQAEQLKIILEKSITQNEYSELRATYQELKEKCIEFHGKNSAIETVLNKAKLL